MTKYPNLKHLTRTCYYCKRNKLPCDYTTFDAYRLHLLKDHNHKIQTYAKAQTTNSKN